jgi:hypothetical protein
MNISTLPLLLLLCLAIFTACQKDAPTQEEEMYHEYGIDKLNLAEISFGAQSTTETSSCS